MSLDAGADDVITKPYELPILLARLRAWCGVRIPSPLILSPNDSERRPDPLARQRGEGQGEGSAQQSIAYHFLTVGDLRFDPVTHSRTRGALNRALDAWRRVAVRLADAACRHDMQPEGHPEKAWGPARPQDKRRQREHPPPPGHVDTGFETQLIQTVRGKGYMVKEETC